GLRFTVHGFRLTAGNRKPETGNSLTPTASELVLIVDLHLQRFCSQLSVYGSRFSVHGFTVSVLLLYSDAIALASSKGLGVVHLFYLNRGHDEVTRCRSSSHIRISINTRPETRSESFRALIAEVLLVKPM